MQQISTDRLATKLQQGETVVVDVRETDEFAGVHIPGARNVPMGRLPDALADADRSIPVYVVCASGNRSSAMTDVLTGAGFEAANVTGGTKAWIDGGHPTESGASS